MVIIHWGLNGMSKYVVLSTHDNGNVFVYGPFDATTAARRHIDDLLADEYLDPRCVSLDVKQLLSSGA